MGTFLQINKDYMGLGLKSIDLLIISQVEEFERNECQCYVTNKQFSEMFGESESSIKRAIDKLENLNIIKRDTVFVKGNGRSNKQRLLNIHNYNKWKVHNEPTIMECKGQNELTNAMEGSNIKMEGSEIDNGRFKNGQWKVHNDPIKDNKNINNNINKNIRELISVEKKKEVINLFKPGSKILEIAKAVGLDYQDVKKIIDDYSSNPNGYFYEPPKSNGLSWIDKDGNNSFIEVKDIQSYLYTKGDDVDVINDCLKEYYNSLINDGADKNEVCDFFKREFNFTLNDGYKKEIHPPFNHFYKDMIPSNQPDSKKVRDISEFLNDEDDVLFG